MSLGDILNRMTDILSIIAVLVVLGGAIIIGLKLAYDFSEPAFFLFSLAAGSALALLIGKETIERMGTVTVQRGYQSASELSWWASSTAFVTYWMLVIALALFGAYRYFRSR